MKDRFVTILRASVGAQLIFVWVPTFLVGTLTVNSFSEWTWALGTASRNIYADEFCVIECPPASYYLAKGLIVWGVAMGITLGVLYFISGSLRLYNKSEPKTHSCEKEKLNAESEGWM